MKKPNIPLLIACISTISICINVQAQTQAPPALGQDTKGQPATLDSNENANITANTPAATDASQEQATEEAVSNAPFGTTKIKESRRESGQVYLIELEHSSGIKQYIEETDSDGNIGSEATDIENTPNLPKWKLGSW